MSMNEGSDPEDGVTLARLIGFIESNNNPRALRFEPGIYRGLLDTRILHDIAMLNKCNQDTARVIYSMSFGEYQMMGFNIYNGSLFDSDIATFLTSNDLQLHVFADFVHNKNIDYSVDELANSQISRLMFANVYNGSKTYADSILIALHHFGVTTK